MTMLEERFRAGPCPKCGGIAQHHRVIDGETGPEFECIATPEEIAETLARSRELAGA
jgi:hypothetical protein